MNFTSRLLIALILFLFAILLLGWWFFVRRTPVEATTLIINDRVFRVEIAETMADRAQGLSGREGLRDDEGMLFKFSIPSRYSFWMKDMKFAIDMVWIREGRVLGVTSNVQPEPGKAIWKLTSYPPPEAVDTVLEIKAGGAEKANIKAGDLVVFGGEKVD